MKNIFLLSNPAKTVVSPRTVGVSLPSRCRVLPILFVFLTLCCSSVWGADYTQTFVYSDLGSMLSGSYLDATSYWKVPETSGNTATVAIPSSYFSNQPTSNVTITLKLATFGSGTNPSSSNTTISAVGAETSSNWTGSGVSTYPSSSSYVNAVLTISKPVSPTTLSGINITIGVNTGVKILRLQSVKIEYTYSSGGGDPTLSSIAVKTPPTKVSYTEGENFNPTGLVITRTYSDESTSDWTYAGHTSDFSFTPSLSTALTTGNTSVTITYGGKSTTQAITVTSGGGGGSCDYEEATSLEIGDEIWVIDDTYSKVMTGATAGAVTTFTTCADNKYRFVVEEGYNTGWFALKSSNTSKYLAWSSSTTLIIADDIDDMGYTDWKLVEVGSGKYYLQNKASDRYILFYNNNNMRAYSSTSQATTTKPTIYKSSSCTTPTDITITSSGSATTGTPLALTYTGGNGGTVTWSVTNGTGTASVTGSTLTPLTAGNVTVKASQGKYTSGLVTYCAVSKTQVINISSVPIDVTLSRDGETEVITGVTVGTALDDIDGTGTQGGCAKWTFIGWSKTARTAQDNTEAMDLVTTVSDAGPYYAVYRGSKSSGSSDYKLVENDLSGGWAGDYLIAYNDATFADGRTGGESGIGANGGSVDPTTNLSADKKTVAASWGDTYKVTLEEISTGSNTYLLKTQDNKYNYRTSNANGISDTETRATAAGHPLTITFNSSSDIDIETHSTMFHYNPNSSGYFRFYKDGGQSDIYLYRKATTVNVYSTNATCDPTWTVSFNGNGNTAGTAPVALDVIRTESTTLPEAGNLEKTHYSFLGWNTQPDGLGVTYTAGASFTPTADITLYAKWGENPQYTITWDDGHSDPLPTTSVYAGEKVVLPSDPTSCDPSYPHFMGWYTAPEGSLSAPTTSISGTKVTAQTKPNSDSRYYAVFSNGGTVAGSKEYAFNITPSDFTGGGYSANDGEHTSIATATDASGATFQVTWESKNVYLNGGKAQWKAATDDSYTSRIHNITDLGNVTAVDVTATALDARFDIFSGSTVKPGTSIDFTSGYPFFVIYNWDVTLRYTTNIHIVFTTTGGTSAATGYISTCSAPTTWSVSYNANGKPLSVGSEIPSATTGIPEDAAFAVPSNNYVSSPGFAQIGWNTDPSATVGLTSVPAQTAGTMITLYAIWQKSQIEVVEVDDNNNIYLDHNFGGSTSATLQQEVTTGTGNTATDIFFSKYFESTANVKLVALFNGTGHDIDLRGLRIHIPYGSSAPYGDRYIRLDTLLNPATHPGRSRILPSGQELIIYSWQPASSTGGCHRDNAILESAADKVDMSTWIPIPYNYSADNGDHALCFGGREAILLERDSSTWGKGWKPIDIIGAMDNVGHSIYPTKTPSWGDGNGWNCNSGKSIEDTTEVIGISTNRCLLVRKFSVLDGSKAVSGNIGSGATFSTLCDEWYGLHVQKYPNGSGTGCEVYAQDNNSAADGFSYVGSYDYNSNRQQYVEVADTKFTATYDETTGFTILHINPCGPGIAPEDCVEGGLAGLACDYLKITVTNSEKTQVLEQLEYKVPIIISGTKTTNDAIFSSETACETCDVVVLGDATLIKANDGSSGDQPTIRDLMIYPNGTLHIPAPHTYHVSSVQFRVQGEMVPVAKLQGNLQTPDKKVYVSRRLNNDDAYFFSLPYNCNIADITWSNGDPATLGDGFKIQEYDAATRANEGSTAGVPGHWVDVSGSTLYTKKGYQIMVNSKKLRELIFPMDISSTNVTTAENEKINNTDKVTIELHEGSATKNNWNWNFIAQPYVCAMTPMTGDKITAGWLKYNKGTASDPGEWVYMDGSNEYFTIYDPSTKTYTQKKWNEISRLDPFVAYFVQGKANGEFQFEQSHRIISAPARHLAAEAELEDEDASIFVGVTLSGNGQSDETSLRIRPDFTDEYKPGYDLQKFTTFYTERPQIYMKTPDFSLAFQAVSDSVAKNTWMPVGVYIRDAGTYTFALNENNPIDEVEAVYLYDKTTGTTTNLLNESYTITTSKQVYTNKRFSLNVILNRRAPQVTTDIIDPSGAPDDMVRKILINGHVYIQRGAAIYDITGKQMLNF